MRYKCEVATLDVPGWFVPELGRDYYVCEECEPDGDGDGVCVTDLEGTRHVARLPECECCGLASPPVSP